MGYETLLMIGRKTNQFQWKNGKYTKIAWFEELARIDMNKAGIIYRDDTSPYVFFYGSDGNTEILKDRYDEKLKAYPLNDVLKQLKEYREDEDWGGSRVLEMAITMLEGMADWGYGENPMAVVLYGY